jgi:hypothetical protein
MEKLYLATSTHPDPVIADRAWLSRVKGELICPECNSIDRRRYPAEFNVVLRELPVAKTSGLVPETGISVTRVDFLDEFQAVLREVAFGRCAWQDGKPITSHVTAYGTRYLVLRGGKEDHYYRCKTCGTVNCYYLCPNKYLLRRDLHGGAVYQTTCGTWLFNEETAARIDWSRWPDMELIKVPILEKPREGDACPLPA